jgi:very-short-patch-repair endonuclease
LYELINSTTKLNKTFNITTKILDFESKRNSVNTFGGALRQTHDFIDKIINNYVKILPDGTKVQLCLNHDTFTRAVNLSFTNKAQITTDMLFSAIEEIVQSKKKQPDYDIQPTHKFKFTIKYSEKIMGGALKKKKNDELSENIILKLDNNKFVRFEQYLNSKKCISKIESNDNLCLLRAFLLMKEIYELKNNNNSNVDHLYRNLEQKIENKVFDIAKALNFDRNEMISLNNITKIEDYFDNKYTVTIIDKNFKEIDDCLYIDKTKKKSKFIYLLYYNKHFYGIKSMCAWLDKDYFCDVCKKGYKSPQDHRCDFICKSCFRKSELCLNDGLTIRKCLNENNGHICNCIYYNDKCFEYHRKNYCNNNFKICEKCNTFIKNKNLNRHVCLDERWCSNCSIVVDLEHKCYMKKNVLNDKSKNNYDRAFVFFDFECFVNKKNVHQVNLAKAQMINQCCINKIRSSKCKKCSIMYTFYNITDFCTWSLNQKNTTQIAHNLKGYDGLFILREFLINNMPNDNKKGPESIVNGTKIISIHYKNCRYIDSYSFISAPLSSFTKTFSLNSKKGFFPHKFNDNSIECWNYIGPYPCDDMYECKHFSNGKKKEYDDWMRLNRLNNFIFNFKQEFESYCEDDVRLLTDGCLIFRYELMSRTTPGLCPFINSITAAGYCNLSLRSFHLVDKTIAIIPLNGYNPEQNVSNKAMLYLKNYAEKNKIHIQHAKNGGEKKIGNYFVDGFCEEKKLIFEFHGCYFHACKKCYTKETFNVLKQNTMEIVRIQHEKRIKDIKNEYNERDGWKIIEKWECDWENDIKNNIDLLNFIDDNRFILQQLINPRNALFGGRTNAVKLYFRCKEGEFIRYVDVTSLYPFVQKYKRFILGHPIIIFENFDYGFDAYFGIIKCEILPPQNLRFPVLPARINNKLVFTLCYTCALEAKQISINGCSTCEHALKERSLTGEWCTPEIYKAVSRGYKMLKIYQVWHWTKTEQYDPNKAYDNDFYKKNGLFTSYIDQALKGKQEASGYPIDCESDEQKDQYIIKYFNENKIKLDKNLIKLNKGKRMIEKLIANSMWGYLAMNTNKPVTKIIRKLSEWNNLLNNEKYLIKSVDIIDDDDENDGDDDDANVNDDDDKKKSYLHVIYSINDEFLDIDKKTNVVLAAFVTCYARLHLLDELEKLDDRVLYFDTDSIIYVTRQNDTYQTPLGVNLGEWTNEIDPSDGKFIVEIVSAGPKSYITKTDTGVCHCVIKGFTLNYITSLTLNFEAFKDLVLNNRESKITTDQLKFRANKLDHTIETKLIKKNFGFVYDKRILLDDLSTIAYGFKI